MADKCARHAGSVKMGWFKGKQCQNVVDVFLDLVDPFWTPCPNLGGDVVDARLRVRFQPPQYSERKTWRVDRDDCIGAKRFDGLGDIADAP